MRGLFAVTVSALAAIWCLPATGQQGGGFGGGGFGGGQGGGAAQQNYEGSAQAIETKIGAYLEGDEIKNILTPGEYSEWPLTLKDGQVVIAEARSDAFDPALEIVDSDGKKVLASNDDRYPGDQRPLLLWRCAKGGSYSLRARCFHDKSGGQFYLRFKVFDCVDAGSEYVCTSAQDSKGYDIRPRCLIRIPMKAGEIEQVSIQKTDQPGYIDAEIRAVIGPTGLPDVDLGAPLTVVAPNVIVAPVAGDYYELAFANGTEGKISTRARSLAPVQPVLRDNLLESSAATNAPAIWSITVKAGDVLEASTPDVSLHTRLAVTEKPDFAKYDLSKPETNPFFPKAGPLRGAVPAFNVLPARATDGRHVIFVARRDTTLWLASSGESDKRKEFTLRVVPATRPLAEGGGAGQILSLGNTDYWTFDAHVGDVIALDSKASGFTEQVIVRDPELTALQTQTATPDDSSVRFNMIVQKAGRYLVAVSSMGGGGGGSYTLERKVIPPAEFSKGKAAQGDFTDGQVHVWKFTVKPGEPMLMRWRNEGPIQSQVSDSSGVYAELGLTQVNETTSYAILTSREPRTYLIVLYPSALKSTYRIELSDLPGMQQK